MFSYLPGFIPDVVLAAPFVIAFCILCAKPLHEHPLAFYIPWTALVVLFSLPNFLQFILGGEVPGAITALGIALGSLQMNAPVVYDIINLLTNAVTGVLMYFVVMFIGALEKGPTVKKLYLVRSELSVLAGIIVMGHVCRIMSFPFYFASAQFRAIWGDAVAPMFIAAVVIGIPLTVCFLIPWITSFKCVRKHMKGSTWKKVQKTAYPMMALMVLQGMLLGIGHALVGCPWTSQTAMMQIVSNPADFLTNFAKYVAQAWVYSAVGVTYLVLRVRKARRAKKTTEQTA